MKKPSPVSYNPVAAAYEAGVLDGSIVAGRLLRLAVERHRRDLATGHERGLWFDHAAGQKLLDFFGYLNLAPGKPFRLMPWNLWELYVFYGWRRANGRRRFTEKYKSVARKNAKTPLESGQILYHLTSPALWRGEAYVSATKEDQAKICFNDAKVILENSPILHEVLDSTAETIFNIETGSRFQFLTSNPKTADGSRPSYVVIDEYHEFDNDEMLIKLQTGSVIWPEPIFNIVTTRGTKKEGFPCFEAERKKYIPILEGEIEDDATFVLIFAQDEEAEHEKPETWEKSNPMLCAGGILELDRLIEARRDAQRKGEERVVGFNTLNLNWWSDPARGFIPADIWRQSGRDFDEAELAGRECWAGLDMSQTDDFTAAAFLFPPENWRDYEAAARQRVDDTKRYNYYRDPGRVPGEWLVFWRYWIPEYAFEKRIANGLFSLRDWRSRGLVRFIEGNVIDPRVVEAEVGELHRRYPIRFMCFDRFNATSTVLTLQEQLGVTVRQMDQNVMAMNEPTKALRNLVQTARFNHGQNPVSAWMLSNSVLKTDPTGNIKIEKDPKQPAQKIDGMIAAIMALSAWMVDDSAKKPEPQFFFG